LIPTQSAPFTLAILLLLRVYRDEIISKGRLV
jgi:hypothetical protein